jgi:hypothetical protein
MSMASTRQTHRPAYLGGGQRTRDRPAVSAAFARYIGALALLAMAAIHLEEYAADSYSKIPTIGTLFLLNFIGGTALALALMSPLDRLSDGRGRQLLPLLALAGAAMAAVSIVFLLVSESTTLFGFREAGYRPAIVLALIAEGVAFLCLAGFAANRARTRGGR